MNNTKDVMLAALSGALTLAGLLLVFAGSVALRAESMDNKKRARIVKRVAQFGLVPFLGSLLSALLCVQWLVGGGDHDLAFWGYTTFLIALTATGLYGAVTMIFFF